MTEHTGASYQGSAGSKYAQTADTRPANAYYERPAVLSLLPVLANQEVLDAGCGPGWYTEYLLDQGATVTACDVNAEFVRVTQARVGSRATVLQANLAEPLDFAADGSFDLVVASLVLHYLKEWQPTLREFYRVLKPQGRLVFSTHHPFMDWKHFETESYFIPELIHDEWDIGPVEFYRRPLTLMSHDLEAAGFVIERLLEPQPTPEYWRVNPEQAALFNVHPWFLVIRAKKEG
ncbi:MAG: methyltransferase domain-containing protein [Anaerolineae bacterium]|nr:methyltransferase domain-containing protein [Anaerolineae bacterium]MCB0226042.1 methyltransferase domain-containing protein [Anaerolineae bacterium]